MKKRFKVSLLFLLSILGIVSCSGKHIAEKPDTVNPTVVSTFPASNATAVAVSTTVTVTFSKAMNEASINNNSFHLMNATTGTIAGTVTYDPAGNAATFAPGSDLDNNAIYTAVIDASVKDLAGNTLASLYSWTFTTIPASGAPDATFGSNGKERTELSFSDDIALAAVIQQDGKIVTAGYSTVVSSVSSTTSIDYYVTICRFQPNGGLDPTFGIQLNGIGASFPGTARSVGLESDGKIVVAGDTGATAILTSVTTTPNSDFLIARYNVNGTLDTTFGLQSNGTVTMNMGHDYDVVRSLAIQSDGKIVVAGDGINSGSLNHVSIMARFNTDGTLDTTFADNGKRVMDAIGTTSRAWVVKIQSDGKIVAGGNFQDGSGPPSFYLARYEANGTPDTSFSSGMVTASPAADPVLTDIAILSTGKIIVAGSTNVSTNADVFLMRYNADGTLDTTFGSAGTVITNDYGSEEAAGLAVQADGKIVVAAIFHPIVGPILTNDFALFRYHADGVLDTTFGNGYGMVTTDLSNGNDDFASDVQIQQDGKIVVVGTASNAIGLARYWP